jgi:aminoglycoside N3'-acetyltransferase
MSYVVNKSTTVTQQNIGDAIQRLGLNGKAVCLHSSLSSFGRVDGGADTVIDAFLESGCTLLVPVFSSTHFEVQPERCQLLERNGWDVIEAEKFPRRTDTVYSPDRNLIDADMGAISVALLQRPERVRGNHPLNSFAAIGPQANDLVAGQSWKDVYAPLRELTKINGCVVLAGVDLNRMTILHLAEALAGRRLFRRWATGSNGSAVAVPIGGCSEGFPNLENVLGLLATETIVGTSKWRVFPSAESVTTAAAVIRTEPGITHCGDPECLRCPHAVAGGPHLSAT